MGPWLAAMTGFPSGHSKFLSALITVASADYSRSVILDGLEFAIFVLQERKYITDPGRYLSFITKPNTMSPAATTRYWLLSSS